MLDPSLVKWMEDIENRVKNLETQLDGKFITISGASEIIEGFETALSGVKENINLVVQKLILAGLLPSKEAP